MDVGVDIVEINRISKLVHHSRFLKRVFTPQEVAYCRSRKNSAQHFAVRFAAKEAVWKAIAAATVRQPSGRKLKGARLLHRDIQVRNRANGKPEVIFPNRFSALSRRVSISLSHGRQYAIAMAVFQ